ncbi:MAG TPA: lytic transglycosylase domain-containing protein [Terriglobus sp.]
MASPLARVLTTACLMLGTLASAARAAEVVTLRNGFTVTCQHREALSAETVRLYLHADSYMDVATSSIVSVETVADIPAPALTTQPTLASNGAILADSGARHNVNVDLLASVVKAESGGNAHAVSRTGARGLMQLMPGTAAQLDVKDSFDPASNVNGGSAYLDQLLTRYHENLALALAAYNAGPGAVDRYHGIPPYRETRAYVARVIREFNRRVAEQARAASATVVH